MFLRVGQIVNFFLNNHSKISHVMQSCVVYIITSFSSPSCMNVCMNAVSFVSFCCICYKTNNKKIFCAINIQFFGGTVDLRFPITTLFYARRVTDLKL